MSTYIVNTPLKVPVSGAKKGTFDTIPPGKPVELDDADAAPLLACRAIRKPDVVEQPAQG